MARNRCIWNAGTACDYPGLGALRGKLICPNPDCPNDKTPELLTRDVAGELIRLVGKEKAHQVINEVR